jgi:hypothetical protein
MRKRTSFARRVKYVRCASVIELKRLCQNRDRDCKVILQCGLCSVKTIRFNSRAGSFRIANHIDGSTQTVTPQHTGKETILRQAITHGCLGVEVGCDEPFCEHQAFKNGACTACGAKRETAQSPEQDTRRRT